MGRLAALVAMLGGLATAAMAAEGPPPPVKYTLRFPEPHTHQVRVEGTYPTAGRTEFTVMMPVWTPGSYLVREFSRHVESVEARDARGAALPVRKTAKNRWTVTTGGADPVTLRYRVYGREMSVRTNWIEADFALINGAATFLAPVDDPQRPYEVRVEPARAYAQAVTALAGTGDFRFRAKDFDELVDSPIYLGAPEIRRFRVDGKEHVLVVHGSGGLWDVDGAAADLEKVVEQHRRFWGSLPYERFVFLNMLTEASGGLEHAASTVLMASRWDFRVRESYVDWLRLASHELFHAWNVKRLRPRELGPFDYEHENYTRSLWVAEGLTSYYEGLMLRRAGLISDAEYLKGLSRRIEAVEEAPGRRVRSLAEASFDAWIKYYRPDENTANTSVSYYAKGAAVGWLLDAHIRAATEGQRSLDDVMRLAFARYAGARGYTPEELRALLVEVGGEAAGALHDRAVTTTADLDYAPALARFGLRFRTATPRPGEPPEPVRGWIGVDVREDGGRIVVERVRRDTPAFAAGVNADDEILGLDDYRLPAGSWKDRRAQYKPGSKATLLVARRQRLLRLPVTFAAEPPPDRWKLEPLPSATPEQVRQREAWLVGAGGLP